MGRKSSVQRKPPEWRAYLDKLRREDRWTLNELIELMREKFPEEAVPSRTALGRDSQKFAKFMQGVTAAREMGSAMVKELGEDPHDRGGQLLVEAVTTIATNASMDAIDPDAKKLSIKEVTELARGARAVMEARKMSMGERQKIKQEARERAAEEAVQEARVGGVSEATIEKIRERVLRGGA